MFERSALACALMMFAVPMNAATAQPGGTPLTAGAIEGGLWQVTAEGEPARKICVSDPRSLVQVRHGGTACSRMLIASDRTSATVHYSCPGAGWGRTTLRLMSADHVSIQTQGIAQNAPFEFAADAKRIGNCDK